MKTKVLIVDDSALIRKLMSEIVLSCDEFELVGAAKNAYVARDMVKQFQPDVITLDIEMPEVDGLTFLARLMKARPTPVVMISTLTEEGADATLKALDLGAVDFVAKPKIDVVNSMEAYSQLIIEKIRIASKAKIKASKPPVKQTVLASTHLKSTHSLIAIGASTGGTQAILRVLERLPSDCPCIVITQHMPVGYTHTFANRLNKLCAMEVKEAEGNERITQGVVFIAPGGKHLTIVKRNGELFTQLDDSPNMSGHKPSVDKMFLSIADSVSDSVIAVVLTGMGKDGAIGIEALANHKGCKIAQDENSSVVFGMPKEAINTGLIDVVADVDDIAAMIMKSVVLYK